jgi:dienelactone hydrolase
VHRLLFRGVAGVLLLLGFAPIELTAAGDNHAQPVSLAFESAGRRIRVDLYAPAGPRSPRTIIMQYGATGASVDAPPMHQFARALAATSEMVYVLHYFDRTGTITAGEREMQASFEDWLQTVRDGIAWVHEQEGKEGRPVGIYGYSLGAFLAIAASSNNPLVGAVVEQAGGMWNSQEKWVGKMPPVLMVHGVVDELLPLEDYAKPLLRVLQKQDGELEMDFVEGQGHVFSEAEMKIVHLKAADFFARKLPSAKDSL